MDGLKPRSVPQNDPVEPSSPKDQVLLAWSGQEFESIKATWQTKMIGSLAFLGLVSYSAWERDWFIVGILVIVSLVLLWYLKTRQAVSREYRITPLGFFVDEKLYTFSELHSFWVIYNQKVKQMYLAFDRKYLPSVAVDISGVDPVVLKSVLLQKIPEQTKRRESVADKLVRSLGL